MEGAVNVVLDLGYAVIGLGVLIGLSIVGMWLRGDFRRRKFD